MIPIKLEFDGGDLGKVTVYDNLVFMESMKWKLDSFLKCVCGDALKAGKKINFEDPTFLDWLRRKSGVATLKIEQVRGKDYSRNSLNRYVYDGSSKGASAAPVEKESEIDDDLIPF